MDAFNKFIEHLNYSLGEQLGSAGPVASIAIVFAAGLLTSLTPCVYPVIPVTVTFIGGAAGGNRRRAVSLSVVYVLGLAVVYAALGILAALLGVIFGQWTSTPAVWFTFGVVFTVFGLSMFDVIPIRLPSFLTGVQSRGTQRGGYVGAALMGVAAAFVTAPCSAPVLGVLLVEVGKRGDVVWASVMMFVFALGLSMLLLVLGIFSGLLSSLPKPGRWMNWVKIGFGVAMIAVGVFWIGKAFVRWFA